MTDEERHEMVVQMDKDLEAFIAEKVNAYKDVPKEPLDLEKTLKVAHAHTYFNFITGDKRGDEVLLVTLTGHG